MIAENMFAQCDSKGNQSLLLAGIVNHRKDNSAVEKKDMYIKQGSNQQLHKTTKGWSLCVEWKDGTTSWERLADLKESNPVEIAEYAVTHNLDGELHLPGGYRLPSSVETGLSQPLINVTTIGRISLESNS